MAFFVRFPDAYRLPSSIASHINSLSTSAWQCCQSSKNMIACCACARESSIVMVKDMILPESRHACFDMAKHATCECPDMGRGS